MTDQRCQDECAHEKDDTCLIRLNLLLSSPSTGNAAIARPCSQPSDSTIATAPMNAIPEETMTATSRSRSAGRKLEKSAVRN